MPIAHESWGRLGSEAESLLVCCAAAAARSSWARRGPILRRIKHGIGKMAPDIVADEAGVRSAVQRATE